MLLAIIYLSFISLGLPDALLGSAWPTIYPAFGVPVSYSGIISMIISAGTIISSLQSDRLKRLLGTGRITVISVGLTAAALMGFSLSKSFMALCIFAVPYGLGAGSVDAALNNYVALHYSSRHMSWLHCMWGIGATAGPYIMGYALTRGSGWQQGYLIVGLLQIALTLILIFSLPIWKAESKALKPVAVNTSDDDQAQIRGTDAPGPGSLTLRQIFRIPGAKPLIISFFCYMALEVTTSLWASSYMTLARGIPADQAASHAGLFFIGMTAGRAISGFMTMRLDDTQMIRLGQALIFLGLCMLLLPAGSLLIPPALVLVGLGCAPIYPCIIHSTPEHFGAERSQAVIGVQMASAYVGSCLTPPFFGSVASRIGFFIYPVFLLGILALMVYSHERLVHVTKKELRDSQLS